jgi:hypothetical protein
MRHFHHPLSVGDDVGLSQVQRNKNTKKVLFLVENYRKHPVAYCAAASYHRLPTLNCRHAETCVPAEHPSIVTLEIT